MIIPFFIPHGGCPHQCVFCNQKNITGRSAPPEPSSVPATIRNYLTAARTPAPAQVAFYGGSFTALPVDLQRAYLTAVQPFVETGEISGIRISTRPDAVSTGILGLLERYRVRIVELGAQSMDDTVLQLSGRGHRAEDTGRAVHLLRECGFGVGLQLMAGLPGDSVETFGRTIGSVIALRPDLVRIYPVLVIRDTPLEALYRSGRYSPLRLDDAVARCGGALARFRKAGIDVVRIGLQPAEELERRGTIVAGPYHPAFRQLVESALLLEKIRGLLARAPGRGADVTLYVNPGDLSNAIGQKRENVARLVKEFGLSSVHFAPDGSVPKGEVSSEPACFPRSGEV